MTVARHAGLGGLRDRGARQLRQPVRGRAGDARMSVAYVMNQMLHPGGAGDYRALGIVMAAYEGLRG